MGASIGALGMQVRFYRLEKRLTQEQLAELAGVSPNFIQLVESGKETPGIDLFIHLSDILEVLPSQLLEGREKRGCAALPGTPGGRPLESARLRNRIAEQLLSWVSEPEPTLKEHLGRRISKQRSSAELSRKELANRVGISVSQLGNIESGVQFTTLKTLHAISRELCVPIEVFLQDGSSAASQSVCADTLARARERLPSAQYAALEQILELLTVFCQ